jgi:glycosyltransferase involved in cell wall biosynthesis
MSRPIDEVFGGLASELVPLDDGPLSFAVIIRTQGRRPGSLNDAVDAVLAQTHPAAEILLVVHGDGETKARVNTDLDGRTVTLLSVEGGGRSTPLNTGLDAARARYVCFLDDDDLVTTDWLSAFARAASGAPGTIIRAVTTSQAWSTEGTAEPRIATGEVKHPFPASFDLLAHMSLNQTPICAVAYPREAIDTLGIRFCGELAVYEDWDFLMHAAMPLGVTSIPNETSLYRRLNQANADSETDVGTWERAHAMVIDRLSASPVVLPSGDARRLAGTHFQLGARSRHESDLTAATTEIDRLTRSPLAALGAFGRRLFGAIRRRT